MDVHRIFEDKRARARLILSDPFGEGRISPAAFA